MRMIGVFTMFPLILCIGSSGAQTAPNEPPIVATPSDSPGTDSLRDLGELTLSCPRAALNAAAREAARVPARGTYHFSYFNIVNESHHARYEVHFRSNYEGEPELKYCVVLYCQQGWDPAQAQTAVTLLSAKSSTATAASQMASCTETGHVGGQISKQAR